jgi:hypothetical protein
MLLRLVSSTVNEAPASTGQEIVSDDKKMGDVEVETPARD